MLTRRTKSVAPSVGDLRERDARIAALRKKDPAACEAIVRELGGQMLAIARRYLQSDQDCEDAVQEAFLSAFRAIERFEGNSELGTWLHRIVVNTCLMRLRSRSRRHEVSIEALLPTFDQSGHHSQAIRPWRGMPDEKLLREETRATVRRCIDMLPAEYRTVLLLRDIEQLSTEDAADVLNATPGAVKRACTGPARRCERSWSRTSQNEDGSDDRLTSGYSYVGKDVYMPTKVLEAFPKNVPFSVFG